MLESSACQRETVSCGACCGIFNLDLDVGERRDLLLERTRDFRAVRFQEAATFVSYRRGREDREEPIPRLNHETYVCPFFGYLADANENAMNEEPSPETRVGCMIHPARTGLPHTQNFSFYGASICRDYDCAGKEGDTDQVYSRFLERHFKGEQYGRLMGDVVLYSALEKIPGFPKFLESPRPGLPLDARTRALLGFLKRRLDTPASRGITSFEIKFRWFEELDSELLHLLEDKPSEDRIQSSQAEQVRQSIRFLLKNSLDEPDPGATPTV